jgi:1,4-alpha-glucan branching enzyme
MLDVRQIQALLKARHSDPFSVLGQHLDASGHLHFRAVLPGAVRARVVEAGSGLPVTELQEAQDPALAGFFEGTAPKLGRRLDYRWRVVWKGRESEGEQELADAYAFGPLIEAQTFAALREGRHGRVYRVLGAHVCALRPLEAAPEAPLVPGVRFAVWAPNAKRVSVVGQFNVWDGRRHPMRLRHDAGVWEIFVPHAAQGDLYKFEIVGSDGQVLPLKADPYARRSQLRPETASIVAAPLPEAAALPASRAAANRRDAPIAIYEVHAASWRRSDGAMPSWDELAQALPAYARGLGFTHVELMPVSEHPFDGSWGYQTLGQFSVSARFGEPNGFARFVRACHEQGLGVLVDWVPAHFPTDAHGLARFDGTALFEYGDPKEGFHREWNTYIYNFGRLEVRDFLASSAAFWLDVYGVDGLRVDAVSSMLYRDYSRPSGEWVPNVYGGRDNLEAISMLRQINEMIGRDFPGAITCAEESTSFPAVSAPTSIGGLGFHYKWNMGWMNDTLRYIHENPVHRRWHHDKMTFGLVYAFSENFILPISHDEVVHGKGSMLSKMPGDEWQKFANLRAYFGFMWGHPGKKLLFMGQEFAQRSEWNHDAPLPWSRLGDEPHAGVQRLVGDLNRLYAQHPALHRLDCEAAGFEWLQVDDREQSVLAWARHDGSGSSVLVVCNFTPVPRHGYRLAVPGGPSAPRAWKEGLNTDSAYYGGSNQGNMGSVLPVHAVAAAGHAQSISLSLPPLAVLFLVPA